MQLLDWFTSFLPEWIREPGRFYAYYAETLYLIPLFPFVGFLINGLCRKSISREASGLVACLGSGLACFWAFLCFFAANGPSEVAGTGTDVEFPFRALHAVYANWIEVGSFQCAFGLYLDQLSGVMTLVITGVGTLIHIYSMGYMGHDKAYARYFAYLNLFLFAMLLLVLGDNLILLFVGWEGVGLCSYLLIGFWYEDAAKAAAGMKAFVFNRVGDLGFLLGIFTLFAVFGTVNFVSAPVKVGTSQYPAQANRIERPDPEAVLGAASESERARLSEPKVFLPAEPGLFNYAEALRALTAGKGAAIGNIPLDYNAAAAGRGNLDLSGNLARDVFPNGTVAFAVALACLLLFVGATGKSAQLPLYAWLPDAMAGPTPVSALIHAATMVTAGVYMVTRLGAFFAFSESVLAVVGVVGALTAIFAALCGLTQTDIKKVLAYSTVSQLGYMFLGAATGAFGLAIFHVVTHAFFKALLFLGAGSVIHGMHEEQDMRKMGGLRRKMPITFWTMLLGSCALSGVPFTAGWYSKDEILGTVLAKAESGYGGVWWLLYGLGIVAAFCTAFYTFRLMGLTFFGSCRAGAEKEGRIHESPPVMTVPLMILAVFSLVGGVWFGSGAELPHFVSPLRPSYDTHLGHALNLALTTLAALGGIGLALLLYVQGGKLTKPEPEQGLFYKLSLDKFYVERFYDQTVTGAFRLGSEVLHLLVDVLLIDTLLVYGLGGLVRWIAGLLRRVQTGVVNVYAAGIVCGALLVLYKLLKG
ncbi:MAG: NADH-quinone oxidoreductase subunit L [Planctomycetota bacterium]|nr:NADH-quinone oxidoreductase subunit L [Planctomycetota bacterium]